MIQLYVVSVVTLCLAGTTLAVPLIDDKISLPKLLNRDVLGSPLFRMLLGLATFLGGFLQFLFVPLGDVAVIGNLFPALGGIIAGFTLCLLYYQDKATVISDGLERLMQVFIGNRDVIGMLALLIAVLHFLFPAVILL
ncbi:hypothetical protein [Spirochaeta africana]|nr:hypothetical protein [Spirochaeta africana]